MMAGKQAAARNEAPSTREEGQGHRIGLRQQNGWTPNASHRHADRQEDRHVRAILGETSAGATRAERSEGTIFEWTDSSVMARDIAASRRDGAGGLEP
jgi:hypothetical protein